MAHQWRKSLSTSYLYGVAIVLLLLYHLGLLQPLSKLKPIQPETGVHAPAVCDLTPTSLGSDLVFNRTVYNTLCQCSVQLPQSHLTEFTFPDTTCSLAAFERGDHQKVVAFSFYGDARSEKHKAKEYFQGIEKNLSLMGKYYPGWTMRLYFDLQSESDERNSLLDSLCQLSCQNVNFDLCHIQQLPGTPLPNASRVFAMNWRFFPTLDPQVDVFVSRDLDSLFSDREHAAVQEWLASPYSFHMMRDHPAHVVSILGSGWGVKLNSTEVRSQWKSAWMIAKNSPIMWATRNMIGPDQGLLKRSEDDLSH
eukprot:snap_masked-scaffold186_size273091-processed-gene-1.3 protein:Tk00913 transcript:snap_masked-scaffold186_size273091-processed-gene-1.3-mRNA-1 annotation:"hypothetical protein DAPPUDRAFT_320085"